MYIKSELTFNFSKHKSGKSLGSNPQGQDEKGDRRNYEATAAVAFSSDSGACFGVCLSPLSVCVCVSGFRQMMHAEGSSLYRLRALTSQRAHVKRRHRDDSDMQLMHSFEGYRLPL